jgi:prepilin-type N-terminal cleavage/methylation domain-containing protein
MKKKGFTLIELVVVMAIIAILALMIVGAIVVARRTAIETANRTNAKSIQAAMEAAYSRTQTYPTFAAGTTLTVASANAALTGVALDTNTACTTGTFSGGGQIVTSATAGQPAYTITIGNFSCGAGVGGAAITGPTN